MTPMATQIRLRFPPFKEINLRGWTWLLGPLSRNFVKEILGESSVVPISWK